MDFQTLDKFKTKAISLINKMRNECEARAQMTKSLVNKWEDNLINAISDQPFKIDYTLNPELFIGKTFVIQDCKNAKVKSNVN